MPLDRGITVARLVLWAVVGLLILAPLTAIVVLAVTGRRVEILTDPDVLIAGWHSLLSAVVSAAIAIVAATAAAILLERSDLAGRGVLRLLVLSPLFVPPFVGAIAWVGVAGPMSPINQWWAGMFGGPLWSVYGADGVILLLAIHSAPVAYLIIAAALRRIPADLELAARAGGASPGRVVFDITLPLLRPALAAAGTLVAVGNLADFGIPSVIGLPERFTTLATVIYRFIQSGTVEQPLEAVATIGVVLLVIAALGALAGGARRIELDTQSAAAEPIRLGRARLPLSAGMWLVVLAVTALPLLALIGQSILRATGLPFIWQNLTFDHLVRALTMPSTIQGAALSIGLSLVAAAVCTVLGLSVGVLLARTRARSNPALRSLVMLPQAVPGLVIAVGWLILAPRVGLFNSPWLIALAYCMAFLAIVVQAVVAPLRAVPAASEEAARMAGASPLRALADIPWRAAIPAALSGGVLVFLTAVRELTISAILVAPGSRTLGVAIFNLQQAGDYGTASALSLIVTLVGLAGLALSGRLLR